mgnify:CR=1 FL=1
MLRLPEKMEAFSFAKYNKYYNMQDRTIKIKVPI